MSLQTTTQLTDTCSIRSVDVTLYKFEAYGMEQITGAMMTISAHVIRKLFPNLDQRMISNLKRTKDVVFLLGMKHTSWHPEQNAVNVPEVICGCSGGCLAHALVGDTP